MKKFILCISSALLLFMCPFAAHAQKRSEETNPADYSGPIIKKKDPSEGANFGNLFNVKTTHSLSASFTSFGGHAANVQAFTNSMRFFFSKDFTGQVDVSLLHSNFGSNNLLSFNNRNSLQVALDAQLNYQINDNMDLHFEINRSPGIYGYSPAGYGAPYGRGYFLGY